MELVRRFFEASERSLKTYWDNPRSLAEAVRANDLDPEAEEMWTMLDPDVVWNTDGLGTFRGQLEIAGAWDDILAVADDYSISLRELVDCGPDRVLATVDRRAIAKGSGINATFPLFTVITVRAGSITQLDEYPDRNQALEAAGLSD